MERNPAEEAVFTAADQVLSIDDLIESLGVSEILDALGISVTELAGAHTDTDLRQTLWITHEFLMALQDSNVLGTFLKLRRKDQANFLRWIGTTDDHEIRAEHTSTFVAALRGSPLGPGTRSGP